MIRVYITDKSKDGVFPYRIEGHSAYGGTPIMGRKSKEPLLDACRVLASLKEPSDHMVGLFHEGRPDWLMRTSVGYGSRHTVREDAKTGPRVVPFVPDARFPSRAETVDALKSEGGTEMAPEETGLDAGVPTDAPPATPEEPPPPGNTPPGQLTDTGPAPSAPASPGKSHHRPRLGGSGARRGSR